VDDLIGLVGAVDGILRAQSIADAEYFLAVTPRGFSPQEQEDLKSGVLRAYRWQYIITGVQHKHFARLLGSMVTPVQMLRINEALVPIAGGA
jgi:hypothetical protein